VKPNYTGCGNQGFSKVKTQKTKGWTLMAEKWEKKENWNNYTDSGGQYTFDEEIAGIFLMNNGLFRLGFQFGVDLHPFRVNI
jgi:hypothetical protein